MGGGGIRLTRRPWSVYSPIKLYLRDIPQLLVEKKKKGGENTS